MLWLPYRCFGVRFGLTSALLTIEIYFFKITKITAKPQLLIMMFCSSLIFLYNYIFLLI